MSTRRAVYIFETGGTSWHTSGIVMVSTTTVCMLCNRLSDAWFHSLSSIEVAGLEVVFVVAVPVSDAENLVDDEGTKQVDGV